MGKLVNVVLPGGRVVSVPEEDAKAGSFREAAPAETEARVASGVRNEEQGGVLNALQAGAEGAFDTVTAGAYGYAVTHGDEERARQYHERAQAHPAARTAGEIGGFLLPTGLPAAAGVAGKAVEGAAGKLAGRAVEGAIVGAGAHVSHSNATGDPLSVEGLVEDMTIGGALNVGFGALADKLKGVGKGAKASAASGTPEALAQAEAGFKWKEGGVGKTPLANAARAREAVNQAELSAAKDVLDTSPAYANYKAKYDAANEVAAASNKVVDKEEAAYKAFTSAKGINNAYAQLERAQQQIRERVQKALVDGAPEEAAKMRGMGQALDSLTNTKSALRTAIKDGDYEGAANIMRSLRSGNEIAVPGLKLPEVPPPPGVRIPLGPDLPDALSELGSKRASMIAEIANSNAHLNAADEMGALGKELGIEAEGPGEALSEVHKHLREGFTLPAHDAVGAAKWEQMGADVEAARATDGYQEMNGTAATGKLGKATGVESGLDTAIDWTRHGAQTAAARLADIGGWKGGFLRVIASKATGGLLNSIESAVAGSAVEGSVGLRAKIGMALAAPANKLGEALGRMGPVTDMVFRGFPNGQHDPETDEAEAFKNRMRDLQAATVSAPDASYELVKPVLGQPNDMALKLHQKLVSPLQYLVSVAPKDPGINTTVGGSDWRPSPQQINTFAHQWEAVLNPMAYLVRTMAGDGNAAGIDALGVHWPALLQEARSEAAMRNWKGATAAQIDGLSKLFQQPVTAAQHPDVVTTLQGYFLPRPSAGPSAGGKPGFGKSPQAVGRPAAVQSSVAGASVSNLIH